jgi:hypothetical protein
MTAGWFDPAVMLINEDFSVLAFYRLTCLRTGLLDAVHLGIMQAAS